MYSNEELKELKLKFWADFKQFELNKSEFACRKTKWFWKKVSRRD